jgi:hypothetical protein
MSQFVQQGPVALFFMFVIVHALADFPLQGAYLARYKIRKHAGNLSEWVVALTAHSMIHGGGVWLVSGSLALGMIEVALHGLIDFAKGEGLYNQMTDHLLHLACKAGYAVALMNGPLVC